MRRTDREVTDRGEILNIMDGCDSLSLALMDGDYPYVIEMNFGWEDADGKIRIYVHGAKDGHKLELIRKNPRAAFCMSTGHDFVPGKVACAATFKYLSVCGRGEIHMVEGDERMHALSVIMAHYDPENEHVFEEKHANSVSVMRFDVEVLTGKKRIVK